MIEGSTPTSSTTEKKRLPPAARVRTAATPHIGDTRVAGSGERFDPNHLVTYDGIMLWEKHGSSFEVRTQGELPDGRPALDEIVASGASIHLEQMSHDQWFMGIEAGGKYFHLNFYLMDGRLQVNLSDQDEANYTDWEGDSRERPFPGPAL